MALRIDRSSQRIYNNWTYQISTPDGLMYVALMENDKLDLIAIDVSIGKAGGSLRAWAQTYGRFLTMLLEHGASVEDICDELEGTKTDKSVISNKGIKVGSGPEGIYHALMGYKRDKYERLRKELKVDQFRGSIRHA